MIPPGRRAWATGLRSVGPVSPGVVWSQDTGSLGISQDFPAFVTLAPVPLFRHCPKNSFVILAKWVMMDFPPDHAGFIQYPAL